LENTFENFVGVYKNAFNKEYCESVIANFDSLTEQGFTKNRQEMNHGNKTEKDDSALWTGDFFNSECSIGGLKEEIGFQFNSVFWDVCYPMYANEYSVLKESGNHHSYGNKVQRTDIGQGYHVWHYESSDRESSTRLLAYILYLNDVEEGGETEFLYGMKRYKPEQGTLIIFPAAFTHTHRGNPPLSNSKYIITGWVEF
jgi:hypothetical protein